VGSNDGPLARKLLAQGVRIAVQLGALLTVLLLIAAQHLDVFGLNPEVLAPSKIYLQVLSLSLIPGLLFTTFRAHLQSKHVTRSAVYAIVTGNLVNIVLNYMLVFGNWGAPRLEAEGSAWATVIARVIMAAWIGFDIARREGGIPLELDREQMRRLWKVGLPSALQTTFEVGVFAYSTTLAGRLAPQFLAAHQVVLNIASVAFMVPYGIGSATAVMVGRSLGEGNPEAAILHGRRGITLGVGFMATTAILFFFAPGPILALYTDQVDVISASLGIIWIAALFQLSDGAQAVATGALRGASDTRSSAFANLIGHWGIGLPLGYYLCFHAGKSLTGLWLGLAVGLTAVALGLLLAWRRRERQLKCAV
jgi:MATE family multidrug resistance protein